MLLPLPAGTNGTPHQLQHCDAALREAEQHQDIYLLATGNHLRAYFMRGEPQSVAHTDICFSSLLCESHCARAKPIGQ